MLSKTALDKLFLYQINAAITLRRASGQLWNANNDRSDNLFMY